MLALQRHVAIMIPLHVYLVTSPLINAFQGSPAHVKLVALSAGAGWCARRSRGWEAEGCIFTPRHKERSWLFLSIWWPDVCSGIALVMGDTEHQEGRAQVPHITSWPHKSRFCLVLGIFVPMFPEGTCFLTQRLLWSSCSAKRYPYDTLSGVNIV